MVPVILKGAGGISVTFIDIPKLLPAAFPWSHLAILIVFSILPCVCCCEAAVLEMARLFLRLCSEHGGWSLFKLRMCICIFYYTWTLGFEAHHPAPDFIWKCVSSALKGFFTQGSRQGRSQKKGAGTDGSRHKSVHSSGRLSVARDGGGG